jgi:hypothetical protein
LSRDAWNPATIRKDMARLRVQVEEALAREDWAAVERGGFELRNLAAALALAERAPTPPAGNPTGRRFVRG